MKVFLSYALAIGGVAMVLAAIIPAFANYMLYRDARGMLLNLLRTNPSRVVPKCRSMPGTFLEAIGGAIKIAATVGSTDITVIVTATRPGYDAGSGAVKQFYKKLFGRSKLGAMAAVGGFAIALSSGKTPILLGVFAGLCVVGLLAILIYKTEVDRSLVLARAEVLPEVDRAFAERRLP